MPNESTTHFWMVMRYACGACGYQIDFYLEDGCEGPKDRMAPTPEEMIRSYRGQFVSLETGGLPATIVHTASGRVVLPVPFVAGRCPECADKRRRGTLSHVNWAGDRKVDTTEPPAHAGRFLYPTNWTEYHACGKPVIPGRAHV